MIYNLGRFIWYISSIFLYLFLISIMVVKVKINFKKINQTQFEIIYQEKKTQF